MKSRKLKVWITLCLALLITFQGCKTLSPEQQRFYGLYLTDTDVGPMNATTKNAAAATLLSVLLPGLGHLYLGEPALAFAWLVLGVVTFPLGWPIGAPIAAYSDTDTVNKANVADEYAPIYMAQQGRRQDEERQERLEDSRRRDRRDDRLDEAVIMRGSR